MTSVPYVEIVTESRGSKFTWTSSEQTVVIQFQIDRTAEPEFSDGEFLGVEDDILAIETAYDIFPLFKTIPDPNGDSVIMLIEDITLEEKNNHGWWKAVAKYKFSFNEGRAGSAGFQSPTEFVLPQIKYNFTVGNTTKRITKSRGSTIADEATNYPAAPPDLNGAIGVSKSGIAGADVPNDSLSIQVTAYYKPSHINASFIAELVALVGRVNFENFLGQNAYEVMFLGATGGGGVLDIIPITFDFDIKQSFTAGNGADPGFPTLHQRALPHDIIDYVYLPSVVEDGDNKGFVLQMPTWRYIHSDAKVSSFAAFGFGISS